MTDDKDLAAAPAASNITGSVAQIVSDRELILNRGSENGVREGMYFAVLDPGFRGVTDPETGESLGDFRVVKVTVRAVEVAPRLTLARTFRTRTVNVGGTNASFGSLSTVAAALSAPRYIEQVERLVLDENARRPIEPEESVVDRGDPFEEITAADAEDVKTVTVFK
ncbi:hypothetical protein [Curtobacterium sp. MCBA15_013]|uniref:hypothetical protein n=1 Tax=Curtobacterium sp. MCBA15_013 TaxID=1898739 RepID=UPI0011135B02|nr:hypothetical protein [Curtobacterium sp. MCBA15_013]